MGKTPVLAAAGYHSEAVDGKALWQEHEGKVRCMPLTLSEPPAGSSVSLSIK